MMDSSRANNPPLPRRRDGRGVPCRSNPTDFAGYCISENLLMCGLPGCSTPPTCPVRVWALFYVMLKSSEHNGHNGSPPTSDGTVSGDRPYACSHSFAVDLQLAVALLDPRWQPAGPCGRRAIIGRALASPAAWRARSGIGRSRPGTSGTSARPGRRRTCGQSSCSSSAWQRRRPRRREPA